MIYEIADFYKFEDVFTRKYLVEFFIEKFSKRWYIEKNIIVMEHLTKGRK